MDYLMNYDYTLLMKNVFIIWHLGVRTDVQTRGEDVKDISLH